MRVATEAFQYLALPVGQFVAFAGGQVGQCPFAGVELVVADSSLLFLRGGGGGDSAQQGLYAHHQFFHSEGLLQVIVAPGVETFHHVVHRALGCQEEDGRAAVRLPNPPHHVQAGQLGHHDVCHQNVRGEPGECFESGFAVGGQGDPEVVGFQGVFDYTGQCGFVFYDQYVYLVHAIIRCKMCCPCPACFPPSGGRRASPRCSLRKTVRCRSL